MEVKNGSIEERILEASFHVLEKEGKSKTTTRKIAKYANVSEVTLFRKFKNKKTLLKMTKEYYSTYLIEKLNEIFEYENDTKIEDYLKRVFYDLVNLTETELNIIKIGIEEVRNISGENNLFLKITETTLEKLSEFFTIKIARNEIRDLNPDILSLNIFSILFESIILWKVYKKSLQYEIDKYISDFLDIFLNGIKVI